MGRLVKGDTVLIVAGDDRGKTGRVLAVLPEKGRVLVEGVNFIRRHTRPSQKNPQGGIVQREAAIQVSNVMLYCGKCGRGTRVRHRTLNDERHSNVRECARCGEVLEKPKR